VGGRDSATETMVTRMAGSRAPGWINVPGLIELDGRGCTT
jgi:hypothetical protein